MFCFGFDLIHGLEVECVDP